MTDTPPEETPAEPELDEVQLDYEALFGRQDDWHQQPAPPAAPEPAPGEDLDDDALYAALFGANPTD